MQTIDIPCLAAVSNRHDLEVIDNGRVADLREAYGDGPPVLIDLSIYAILLDQGIEPAAAISKSRIRFTGTDGLRGRVQPGPADSQLLPQLQAYMRTHAVSPGLVYLCGWAFSVLLRQTDPSFTGAAAAAEDGRDGYRNGLLYPALKNGLSKDGRDVTDIGIAPTPALVTAMQQFGLEAGIMLTASHNPSNQNGVKFFCRGRKLLPEGPMGEYSLSAIMFALACSKTSKQGKGQGRIINRAEEACGGFVQFMAGHLKKGMEIPLMIDAANGAFSHICNPLMEQIGRKRCTIINNTPDGVNINASCGVASVEGTDRFEGNVSPGEFDHYPEVIQSLFDHGRDRGDTLCISVDGDGDRGFLLLYQTKPDAVTVINGDRAGFALAGLAAGREPRRRLFAGTVESDIRLFQAVRKNLDLEVEIHCVGDKWLLAGDRFDRLLVGQEVSGHLLVPVSAAGPDGKEGLVLCGNGLLAMLMLVQEYGMEIPDFESGYVRTFYTYNVNKNLFGRELTVWNRDRELIEEAFTEAEEIFSADSTFQFREYDDEPDMMYAGIFDTEGVPEAVVFVRTSGTENKIGTYVRGEKKYIGFLDELALKINANHRSIKDADNPLAKAEKYILAHLSQDPISIEEEACSRFSLAPEDFQALMSGMRREGLV